MQSASPSRVKVLPKLELQEQQAVKALLSVANNADGALALDEAARLSLKNSAAQAWHFLFFAPVDTATTDTATTNSALPITAEQSPELWGYANLLPDGTVQAMVHPEHRRKGVGSELLHQVLLKQANPGVWVHGGGYSGIGFLEHHGLKQVRVLHQMKLRLQDFGSQESADSSTVAGEIRFFNGSHSDLENLVEVNALAFADHPEQGRLKLEDFKNRMEEPWFEPSQLLFLQVQAQLRAFLWLKTDGHAAEVYVAATHPQFHGQGYAKKLLHRGLVELQQLGFTEVTLYVDGENLAAVKLYEKLGFSIFSSDFQFKFSI